MKHILFAAAVLVTLGLSMHQLSAEPVVIGDPNKGAPITTVKDEDGSQVQITTTGISIVDKGDATDNEGASTHKSWHVKGALSTLEDILVPVFFFLFLIAVILGRRYFDSRNDEKRLQLLKAMVEKGQPIPESVMAQLLSPQAKGEEEGSRKAYKRVRNSYAFTLAGVLLIGHVIFTQSWSNTAEMIPALVFLSLGIGGLAGLYLSKREEKVTG